MTNKLFLPPGPVGRRIEGIIVCLSGMSCFLSYWLINFEICAKGNCENLNVTKFFVVASERYLVLGVVVLISGVFLYSNKEIIRIYRLGIEGSALIGVFLSGMIVFGMLKEISGVS